MIFPRKFYCDKAKQNLFVPSPAQIEQEIRGMNVGYKFKRETGREPEQVYFRYYLRLANDWHQTLQGGKLPGISGTYGVAGWGGRKSDGRNGWSSRGSFHLSIPKQQLDDEPVTMAIAGKWRPLHADSKRFAADEQPLKNLIVEVLLCLIPKYPSLSLS